MILIDTSALVDSLSGPRRSAGYLRAAISGSERVLLSSVVLYEWLRGPRLPEELVAQEALFPSGTALEFGPRDAEIAAELYRTVPHARGREIDLAVASTALLRDAELWTLNTLDFEDVPGLRLYSPHGAR